MTKTFKEVPKVETVDFCSLAEGDCFCFNNIPYMKLFMTYEFDDDDYGYNSVNLENGVLVSFSSESRVKPYKDCTVVLYE